MKYKGTMTSAKDFAEAGRLEEWVHLYLLADGGNKPFSDGLKKKKRHYLGPVEMPVSLFTRICGPEEGMQYPVDPAGFERIVTELMLSIRMGNDVPPLMAHYVNGDFELNDGNHRHEALRRLGIDRFPVIVWITEGEGLEEFKERFAEYLK